MLTSLWKQWPLSRADRDVMVFRVIYDIMAEGHSSLWLKQILFWVQIGNKDFDNLLIIGT